MTNIRTYAAEKRDAIGMVIEQEKLGIASCRETVQGPLTLTYRLEIERPTAQKVARFLKLQGTLQAAMRVEAVRIQQANGLIEIQIPSPEDYRITPTAYAMAEASNGLIVAVGWDMMGNPVTIDLAQHGAMFWVGPPRRGKTQSMRSTLYAVSRGVKGRLYYCIICQQSKLHDWQSFDSSKHSMGVVTNFDEIEKAIAYFAHRTEIGRGRCEYALVIDDLPSILQRAAIAENLQTIASVGAGVGVHLLAGTQAAGSKQGSGGGIMENTITARMVYKSASNATAARDAGQGGLGIDSLSSAKGDAILLVDGYPERVATSIACDREIETLPQGRIDSMYRAWNKVQTGNDRINDQVGQVNYPVDWQVNDQVSTRFLGVNPMESGGYPVKAVNQVDFAALRLRASANLTPQQKLQLYGAFKYFGTKDATMNSVFGSVGGAQRKILNDAIAFAEHSQNENEVNPVYDEKIIKFSQRRTA